MSGLPDVMIRLDRPRQTVEGLGACFNELGWDALQLLSEDDRDGVLRELFAPGVGADLGLCRMPIGANDFARDWYSFDETPGDLALEHFSIDNDRDTLVPFIRAAQAHRPDLRLWASPWSPPTWMKTNGHYAGAQPWPGSGIENGLRADQVGSEGTDMFVLDDAHLEAYAEYFARFIDAYRAEGIGVGMVMPQNEFNSAQVFPSCTWTPDGLARFISVLGPRMAERDVEVFVGTQERPDAGLLDGVLRHESAARWVRGAGFQWAGKGAIPVAEQTHPELRLYQTEQECGDGKNDWRHARYAWTLMRHYFGSGAGAYQYWNIALLEGGLSRWGWAQNSLVVVDPETRTALFTYEYQVLKHVASAVRPGARRLETLSATGYENQLAFLNPDGSVVVVIQNDLAEAMPIRLLIGTRVLTASLPADSLNTFVVSR
jgi:glucosylceramidase